jgi:L-threonylcarbamoyladenylate synthase
MARVLPVEPQAASLREAVTALRAGALIAFRTDTLYGVTASSGDPGAVARLRALKGRGAGGGFVSLAGDLDAAFELTGPSPGWVRELARECWPGPVTLVLPAGGRLPEGLRADDGSWAVRVPADPWCRDLARQMGVPLPSTSANRPGAAPARSAAEVVEQLGAELDLVVDGGEVPAGAPPSALVDVRGGQPRLLRGECPGLLDFVRRRASLDRT